MGVVNVKEQRTGDAAGGSVEAKAATRVFTVLMDDQTDTAVRAELAAGIPREGNPHPQDNWRRAKQPQTRRIGTSLMFEVTVPYETEPITEGSDGTGNPLSQPVEIEWSFELLDEAIDSDIDSLPLQNTAEEPFDPPITEKAAVMVLTVVKNEPTFDPVVASAFVNTTNEGAWYGFGPETCWMRGIRAPRIVSGSLIYYRVSYTVAIRQDVAADGIVPGGGVAIGFLGWRRRLLDQGSRTLGVIDSAGVQKYVTILDSKNKPMTEPASLNGKGQRLPAGAANVWLIFRTKRKVDWSKLKVF